MTLDAIDRKTFEVTGSDKETCGSGNLENVQEELPDNTPRFILLSYDVFPKPLNLHAPDNISS